ncbi:MAG: glutamate synthase-related protein [Candidatus Freyarchaeota archaeon]
MFPPRFKIEIDQEKCIRCKRCTVNCTYDALSYDPELDRIVPNDENCVACLRCAMMCPQKAITITKHPMTFAPHAYWSERVRRDIIQQASTGSALISGMGNDLEYPTIFDHLVIDACQVTNPAIDPLREPIEVTTFLGKKPKQLRFDADLNLETEIAPNLVLETPIIIGHISYGAINLNAHKALAMAVKEAGTILGSGEGGLHPELYPYADHIMVQVASGRFGVHQQYLEVAAAVEIKIGQGAKPGHGGTLPGSKVLPPIAATRMIPPFTDAFSPAPQEDIYSIEDLSQLVYALKEATEYTKPVSVKIAAVHNVASIASGIARSGADIITIDGFRGGTGAAPRILRDHVGIPIEVAIAAVDERLRKEGIRNEVSLIASGGVRSAADVVKAICLGADAVAIVTPAMIAMGCTVCQQCHRGLCAHGIATTRPELAKRLNPEAASKRVVNLLSAWTKEIKEVLGALGVNSIDSIRGNREKLRAVELHESTMKILGVKPAGE